MRLMEDRMSNQRVKRLIVTVMVIVVGAGVVLATAYPSHGQDGAAEDDAREDTAAIRSVVESYHEALRGGDRQTAMKLLSEDVMVLESGYLETSAEYLSHHLAADMEFSAAMAGEREVVEAVVEADAGWVISTSRSKGEFRGHQIDSIGVELIVLQKENETWRIRAIHWSSRDNDGEN
jgi:ketosteroid isomerase-like protein